MAGLIAGPALTFAVGLGSAGLGDERRPSQPSCARAARSRSVRNCASSSGLAVLRAVRVVGAAAALACSAASSKAAGSWAALRLLGSGALAVLVRALLLVMSL